MARIEGDGHFVKSTFFPDRLQEAGSSRAVSVVGNQQRIRGLCILARGENQFAAQVRVRRFGRLAVEPHERWVIRQFRRRFPVTGGFHGHSFFVRHDGRLHATPLFVCLLFLEMTDILFAVDSVPAIFGLTREPFVVFTSNVFAILGLRNLYFLLAGAVDKFHYLKYGLGVVLVFVGLKMTVLNRLWHGHFPIAWSLGIIIGVIAVSIALSLIFPRKSEEDS